MYCLQSSATGLHKLATRNERVLAQLLAPADFSDEHLCHRVQHDDLPRIKLLRMCDSDTAAREIARDHLTLDRLSLGPERRWINRCLERAGARLALEFAQVLDVLRLLRRFRSGGASQ